MIGKGKSISHGVASPAVITGYTLLLHINTYFHKITWGDIIDMCHAAYYIW